jgi:arsenate reductase
VVSIAGQGAVGPSLGARCLAEGIGTGLLVATVVGSGIAAQRGSPADAGLQLLENSTATALGLVALIWCFGAVSGAHLNPVVTLAERLRRRLDTRTAVAYIGAQVVGGALGTVAANVMFELPALDWSTTNRASTAHGIAEAIATFGLLTVIYGVSHAGRAEAVAPAVAGYIGAAYWFTSSTSFANPAVTIARTLTDTYAGIAPASAPLFIVAQLAGAVLAVAAASVLFPDPRRSRRTSMPDLESLSPDQRLALRTAAENLREDYEATFSIETIQLVLETSYDQFAGRAYPTHFLPLLAERFTRQRLVALAKVDGKGDDGLPVVLFLCVHNAGRSQMALGWFNHLAAGRAVGWSGGSEPGSEVNPAAVAVMAEIGIDITGEYPKPWTDEIVRAADVVVTMGCGDACPYFPGKRYEDWDLDDPAGQDLAAVRRIRDEIGNRVHKLLVSVDVTNPA